MVSAVAGSPRGLGFAPRPICCLLRYEVEVKLPSVSAIRNKKLNIPELAGIITGLNKNSLGKNSWVIIGLFSFTSNPLKGPNDGETIAEFKIQNLDSRHADLVRVFSDRMRFINHERV